MLEQVEKSSGDSNLKWEMLRYVKENDETLKKKTVVLENIREKTKEFKKLEEEIKSLEKQCEVFKGQIFEMKEGHGISKE